MYEDNGDAMVFFFPRCVLKRYLVKFLESVGDGQLFYFPSKLKTKQKGFTPFGLIGEPQQLLCR